MLTSTQRVIAGPVLRDGSSASYRALTTANGEKHMLRTELTGPIGHEIHAHGRALMTIGHLTDLHMTDVESPARFEFLNRFSDDARYRELLTMQRPQEALNAHALAAMVRAMNDIESAPVSASPLEFVLMTGDAIDNAQANEFATFMALFEGGLVSPASGGPEYEGVQAPAWPDEIFWKPDDGDAFRAAYGFPLVPGLLDRALRPFEAPGLRLPWLGCNGNHEDLCQGVGVVTPELARLMVGGRKPIGIPDGLDAATALEKFITAPEFFMGGAAMAVTPDTARHPVERNRIGRNGCYVHDSGAVRLVVLDSASRAGGADGCVDRDQIAWLERRLIEVHSSYIDSSGERMHTDHENRLVVVATHHPLFAMRNTRVPGAAGGDELRTLLHRFGNVILCLNGHIHMNLVQPYGNSAGGGFWEVTTSSLVDWPCQGRVVEVFDAGGGVVAIACTMLDHDGPADPGPAVAPAEMAGLHRQLAFNDPIAARVTTRSGTPADRNVILTVPAPFALRS